MNDLLRVLDKLLKKRGYTIKKHSAYNVLPLNNFKNNLFLKKTYETFNNKDKTILSDNLSKLNISTWIS